MTLRSSTVVRTENVLTGDTGAPTRADTASALAAPDPSRSKPGISFAIPVAPDAELLGSAPWRTCMLSGPSTRAWPLPIVDGIFSAPVISLVAASVTTRLSSRVGTATITTIRALRPLCRRTSRRAIRRATAQLERHAA